MFLAKRIRWAGIAFTFLATKMVTGAAADLIRMLDCGIRISDFLNAMNVFANVGHTIDRDFS